VAALACALAAGAVAAGLDDAGTSLGAQSSLEQVETGPIDWRRSHAVGATNDGFLIRGVKLPPEGIDHFTWDPVLRRKPNRGWRRWAADTTLRRTFEVIAGFRAAHPDAPRLGIGDLSRPGGGPFGRRFGGLGHASHQNGLDVDLYYPREDGREKAPKGAGQIDAELSRDLVRRFVKAGAIYVFVGPNTGLGRPGNQVGRRVQRLIHHDDHIHVRFGRGRGQPAGRGGYRFRQ
jgi:murein endopeptidase